MIDNKREEITVSNALGRIESALAEAGIKESEVEARWILAEVLSIKIYEIFLSPKRVLTRAEAKRLDDIIKRRRQREPLAYITENADFRGFIIEVSEATLIPRPETELLVDEALRVLDTGAGTKRVLEPCTGSGCISIALAGEFNGTLSIIAIDISTDALLMARKNATSNNVKEKISFLLADLLQPIKKEPYFDLIVSNPPYIRSRDMLTLQAEVRLYEPSIALDGGADGLDYIKRLIEGSVSILVPEGTILLELGMGQADMVMELAHSTGLFKEIHVLKDLSGIERIFSAKKK